MNYVDPQDKVCLLLDRAYMPFQHCTAKAAFYHLLKGHGNGIDAAGFTYKFQDVQNNNITLFPDQPILRSASKAWAIPTVFVTNSSFFYRKRSKNLGDKVTLRQLYSHFQGKCSYCDEKIPFSEASKDHILPRKLDGSDHDFNLTLSCKRCNSAKGHQYPYLTKDGKEPESMRIYSTGFFMPNPDQIRKEWKPYLFLH